LGVRRRILERAKDGCYLSIEASPGSKSSGISGIDQWRGAIKVGVVSPPVTGRANRELIEVFEGVFPEARGRVALVKGEKSRSKRLFVPLDIEIVRGRLGLEDD
jgi:uncharacterized protein (TIGR00251 family)